MGFVNVAISVIYKQNILTGLEKRVLVIRRSRRTNHLKLLVMTRKPLKLRTFPFIIAFLTSVFLLGIERTRADLLVVPNYATNSEVPNNAEGIFSTVTRHQIVFGASEFPSYPIVISQIQWRPDVYTGGPVTNATISNIQINLSTTTSNADQLSLTFSENTGADETVVFSGPLVLSTSLTTLSNGTTAFDIDVPLQTPFFYDPSKGNLLLDLRNFSGASANIYDNSTSSSSDTVSRVFSTVDANATSANARDTGGGAIQITYATASAPPMIISQPTNQTVPINSNATFTVSAIGAPRPIYQWFFNDLNHPIDGATNDSLILLDVQTDQAGIYFVQITNSFGPALSSNAQLTVTASPVISSQPTDQIGLIGGTAAFSVAVSSGVPVTYQWFFDGTNSIAGATNASLILTNLETGLEGFYSVQVSNVYGSVMSSSAALSVQLVIPNYALNYQANDNYENTFANGLRIQTIYGASEFPSFPIIIRELRWRPDTSVGGPLTDNIPDIQINLSTTEISVDQMDFTFANNVGSDNTVVYSGAATLSTSFVTLNNGTKAFDISLQLQTPFLYDSSKGNLLLDVRNFSGGSAPLYTAALTTRTDAASRIVNGSASATTASGGDTAGEAIRIIYGSADIAPIITSQPTNLSVTAGGSSTLQIAAASDVPISYQWFFSDMNNPIAGATNASLNLTNTESGQAGTYFVQATNAYGATLSSNAVLTVTTDPPLITSQPINHSGIVGADFTFSVSAGGSLPLSYQWFYNTNTLLIGATNSSLDLTNIQYNQSGTYSVVVSNAYGVTNSAYAVLTMSYPPVNVLIGSTNISGGNSFSIPVFLVANGNENAVSFSMNFNTQRLTYAGIELGSGAADAALLPNTSQAVDGRLGVTMQLPPGETFIAGTQEIVRVTFLSTTISNAPVVTPVNFTNQPINQFVFDVQGNKLATNFVNGSVTLGVSDFEGDVNPRAAGDHSLDIFDFTQEGRFVAGLDSISNASEFQRADCAPKSTSGDGQLKVTDWVQSGRYAAAVDLPVAVGGPTAPVAPITLSGGPRTITVAGGIGVEGLNVTVPVILQSQGNENGVGFSVNFDPMLLKYVSATKGSAAGSATLLVNTNQAASGTLGVLLALQAGNTFTNGTQAEIARLTFNALDATTNANVTLLNGPVLLAISDPAANELPAIYTNSVLTVNPPPTLSASINGTNAALSWPAWGTGFNLLATDDLTHPWTNVVYTAQTNGSNITLTLPMAGEGGYFRLQHP